MFGRVGQERGLPGTPPQRDAPDWLTAVAGWVVPAANVLPVPTPPRSGLSRGIFRDSLTTLCVGNAMTAALQPRTRWWDGILTMADLAGAGTGVSPSGGSPGSSGSSSPTSADRPDADLAGLEPGDQLAELTRRHADAVYRVALSVTRDHDLAEDVAQDALLKAWQALPSFRGDSPLKNWLLRITHNTAISALRRRRDIHVDPHDLPEEAPSAHRHADESVETAVEARVSIDAFEEALGQLDDLSRSVVVLREVEGLSYDEISEVLGVPLPTVKTRLLRARRLLATALEGWKP